MRSSADLLRQAVLIAAFGSIIGACGTEPPTPLDLPAPSGGLPLSAEAANDRCSAMVATRLGIGTIEDAELVPRGERIFGFFVRMFIKWQFPPEVAGLAETRTSADFCRVTAKLRPVAGSEITAEIWLPTQWNHKLLANGGGGFNGGLGYGSLAMNEPMGKGYATVVTDAGHEVTDSAKFAHDSHEQLVDFGYRANHVAAVFSKALTAAYYGEPPSYAYFQGGSNGGRDALMEAMRFGADFDGIVAGMPAAPWSRLMTAFVWNRLVVNEAPGLGEKLPLIQAAVIGKCDEIDGARDGLLANPRKCPFDPAELQCEDVTGADCLTVEEVEAVRKIYAGPRLRDGTQVLPGMPVGGESADNWGVWITNVESLQGGMGVEGFRWMVYGDADWQIEDFELERDYRLARERLSSILDADKPDLSGFLEHGGKLIIHHGWNDAAIPAGSTIEYYEALRENVGPGLDQQVRLFLVPGMGHGSGGDAPTFYDLLEALERWVEQGIAPERIIASQYDPPGMLFAPSDAEVVRTRPLCPWPGTARYVGSGSLDEAENFVCTDPEPTGEEGAGDSE